MTDTGMPDNVIVMRRRDRLSVNECGLRSIMRITTLNTEENRRPTKDRSTVTVSKYSLITLPTRR